MLKMLDMNETKSEPKLELKMKNDL